MKTKQLLAVVLLLPGVAAALGTAIEGAWVDGLGKEVHVVKDGDGRRQVRVDGRPMALERLVRDGSWRGAVFFAPTPAGESYIKSRAGSVAYLTADGFMLWGEEPVNFSQSRVDGVVRGTLRAWRPASRPWPRFECGDEALRFGLHRLGDLRVAVADPQGDGIDAKACELDISSVGYCPGCRGVSERLAYVVPDRCSLRIGGIAPGAASVALQAGMRIDFHVARGSYLTGIEVAYVREGDAMRRLACRPVPVEAVSKDATSP